MYSGTQQPGARFCLPVGTRENPVVEKLTFSPCLLLRLLLEFPPGELACNLVMTGASSLSFSVCISYLGRFYQDLKDRDVTFSPASIEKELIKFCREARGKENRLVSSCLALSRLFLASVLRIHFPGLEVQDPAHLSMEEASCSVSELMWV